MIEIIPNWHPILVHFTVALFTISIVLFSLASFTKAGNLRQQWLNVAYWNLWIGVLLTIGTLTFGWIAYNTVTHDTPSHIKMTTHRNWAFIASGLFAVLFLWSLFIHKKAKTGLLFVLAGLISVGTLGVTAWYGGEIVYRHGLGVMALPKASDHTHAKGTPAHSHSNKDKPSHGTGSHEKPGAKTTGHSHGDIGNSEKSTDKFNPPKSNTTGDSHNHTH